MDLDFMKLLMNKTGFPQEAGEEALRCAAALAQSGQEAALDSGVDSFYRQDLNIQLAEPLIQTIAREGGVHPYTVWLLFLIQAAKPAVASYLEKGVPEDLVWETFRDLKFKVMECKNVQGVWGNFVAFWYPIFYSCDILKLGRLEFENTVYKEDTPYVWGEYVIRPGDPVKSVHIPSSREPFDQAARLDSYKRAYGFFKEELQGKPLVCVCDSWLLYPRNREILSPTSNIVSFSSDFDVIRWKESEEFHDAWRVFGGEYQNPPADLPENTSMQRAFKKWLMEGKKTGSGFGVLLFDGEKILNRKG